MPSQKQLQDGGKLITLYIKLYKDKYGKDIVVNRVKKKWPAAEVVESVGYNTAVDLLEYYFKTSKTGHPFDWFTYNFEELMNVKKNLEKDAKKRAQQREETKRRVEEWKERNEQLGIKTD